MSDQTPSAPKKRKLRKAPETVRERGARASVVTGTGKPSKFKNFWRRIGSARIWTPFKFVGRFIVPRYVRNSWRELRQVTWPTFKQSRQLTGAVIIFAVIFGIIVAVFDYGLDRLFKQVIIK